MEISPVLLGVIGVLALVQALLVVGLAATGLRTLRRLEETTASVGEELLPTVNEMARATGSLADVTDLAVAQARRVDALLAETTETVERAQEALADVMVPAAARAAAVVSAWQLLRQGLRIYRRLRR